jgi:DNA-binding SARP family transcriptional activator/RecA/RadA recombinase
VHYRVLGPFEVEDGDRVVDLGRPKQRAVLAVLLLEANYVVSLDRLIDLLWGDDPPARSTASLQVYVSNLRRVLEPGRPAHTPPNVLLTRPPGYLLRTGRGELDAYRFEDLAAAGRRLLDQGRPMPAAAALEEALALWRGDALAEFADEKFARPAIARWEEFRLLATEDLVQAELALGAHAPAIATLEGLVRRFPLRERLWGLLMVALYRDGRQAEALRAMAKARTALMEELGIDPGPELARLEGDILAQAPALEWRRAPAEDGTRAPAVVPPERPSAAASPPFEGRTADLALLDAAWREAAAGRGRMVLVAGEPGIGKTRLAEELVARATAAGAAVAWGASNDGEGAPAFWPWMQVLRAVLAQADPPGVPEGVWRRRLAPLVPEAVTGLPDADPPPPLDAESARFRLYEAVMSALTSASQGRLLVVILDDLHWADAASLGLCEFVAARLQGSKLLVVATYRPAELSSGHPLVATLGALARHAALERITLGGLTVEEVGRLVAGRWAAAPSDDFVAGLHARTEGNPFFLIELVRLLASEGRLGRADAVAATQVPAGVRDVLHRRLARLPEATNALLRVAAVVGTAFDLGVLSDATEYDEDDTLEAVEAALLAGIVVEDPAAAGRYRFAHTLVRQALYDGLSAMRRVRLHAKVGVALEGVPRDEAGLAALAEHFYRAAPAIGPEKAVTYALEAASAAQARLAYEEVEGHLGRALDLVEGMPAGSERDHLELEVQNRLALALMMNGGLISPAAARACDRAAELAVRLGDTRQLLSSMAGLSKAAIVRAEWQVVSSLGARMLALGDASADPLSRAAGLFTLGNAALFMGDLRDSRRHIEDAIAIARPLWEQSREVAFLWVNPLVFALAVGGLGLALADDEGLAAAAMLEAEDLADAAGHPFWPAGVQLCAAISHAWGGRVDEARTEAERCVVLGQATGLRETVAVAIVIRSWAIARAHPAPAELGQLRADLAACDDAGVRMWRPFRLALLADACCQARRWDEAVAAADEGLTQCDVAGERVCEADLHRLRGSALAAGGPQAANVAEASICRAISLAGEQGAALFVRRGSDALRSLHGLGSQT